MGDRDWDLREVLDRGDAFGFQCFESPGPWSFPDHGHRGFCELVYVQRGEVAQVLDGRDVVVRAGEALLVREGSRHRLHGSGFSYCNLNVPLDAWRALERFVGDEALRVWDRPVPLRIAERERARFEGMLWDLLEHATGRDAHTRLRAFLAHAVAIAAPAARPAAAEVPAWLRDLTTDAERRLGEDLRPSTLARRCKRSPAHLARSFREHLGCTPTEWVNAARLRLAALWLSRTNRPIIDVCYGLGFGSLTYFYRRFRAAYGTSPLAWRKARTPGPWREHED